MERESHDDNDEHIIDIDDDSSSGSSLGEDIYSSARSSSLSTDEETSDEGSRSSTSGCDSHILWNSMGLVFTLVQIVAALVVFTLAKDEHPQALLLAWLVVYTYGCIISTLLSLFLCLRYFNQVGEYPRTRMEDLRMGLECFFVVWLILGIVWVCDGRSSSSDAPNLYRLCVAFIVLSCIRFAEKVLLHLFAGEGQGGGFVFQGPIHDDSCCICLGKYGEEGVVIRKLECPHVFHLECIDKWLSIKPTCPLCQSLVRG